MPLRLFHQPYALFSVLAGAALLEDDQNGLPKAYLNYLLYDSSYQLIDQGFVQISEEAKVSIGESSAKHEKLSVDLDIQENG